MRKISMKRKSRTPNSENSDIKDDDKSGEENTVSPQDPDTPDSTNESSGKKNKKNKRASKSTNEENGTDKKSKKVKEPVDSDEQYEVEQVLDDKMVRGTRHFLIRWKGFEEESDTWEPEDTLNCEDLIADYLGSKQADSPSKSSKRGKQNKDDKSNKKKKKADADDEQDEGGQRTTGDVYEVDKIIEVHHKRNGQREFLVHWKGYSQLENSWEPEEHMNCPELIERFMAKVERAKSAETRELRVHRQATARFTLSMEQSGRKLSRRNLGKQRVHYHDNE